MKKQKKVKILIAEDSSVVKEIVKEAINEIGYTLIGEASDGIEAVEMACSLKPDVMLMDITMPKLDGLKAAEAIMEQCPLPIVILTGHESQSFVEKASEVGAGAYLLKQSGPEDIKRAITIAMSRHNDLMELNRLNKEVRQRNDELQKALEEKSVLFNELQHRVKNSFTMIMNMLSLMKLNTISDEVDFVLSEVSSRILAISEVYSMLYQGGSATEIQIDTYLDKIASLLPLPGTVSIHKKYDSCVVPVKIAIPIGIIVNELITNVLKHAFIDSSKGKLFLLLKKQESGMLLEVRDNGKGLPEGFTMEKSASLGLNLVEALIKQIYAVYTIKNNKGLQFTVKIPYDKNNINK
jgi:two-component sensor histidine kinase